MPEINPVVRQLMERASFANPLVEAQTLSALTDPRTNIGLRPNSYLPVDSDVNIGVFNGQPALERAKAKHRFGTTNVYGLFDPRDRSLYARATTHGEGLDNPAISTLAHEGFHSQEFTPRGQARLSGLEDVDQLIAPAVGNVSGVYEGSNPAYGTSELMANIAGQLATAPAGTRAHDLSMLQNNPQIADAFYQVAFPHEPSMQAGPEPRIGELIDVLRDRFRNYTAR